MQTCCSGIIIIMCQRVQMVSMCFLQIISDVIKSTSMASMYRFQTGSVKEKEKEVEAYI